MRSSVLLGLLGIAIAVNGCGGSSSGGGTGGAPACSMATGPNSGATCNVVVAAGGPCVTGTFSTAAPPTPAGGAFAGGTYNLASETFYGSAAVEMNFQAGVPFRQTYVLSDVTSTSFTLDQVATTGTVVARSHLTAAVSGMTATFTQTCPAPDGGIDSGGTNDFTATATSIALFWSSTLFQSTEVLTEVSVYDKAP